MQKINYCQDCKLQFLTRAKLWHLRSSVHVFMYYILHLYLSSISSLLPSSPQTSSLYFFPSLSFIPTHDAICLISSRFKLVQKFVIIFTGWYIKILDSHVNFKKY